MKDAAVRNALLFPSTFVPFDAADIETPIHARFEKCAQAHPDAVAARFGQQSLSYSQLNGAANRAARLLLARTAEGASPVALLVDQGLPLVVWILGILKAGLAYSPLDTRLAAPALERMLADLTPRAVIADTANRVRAAALGHGLTPVIAAEPAMDEFATLGDENLELNVNGDTPAYIFYTSGSTGTPKGVADIHRNVMHNVMRYTNSLGFAIGDRMSLIQNPSFSGTVSSLFGALLNGATTVLFDLHARDAEPLGEWVRRERITVFHAVPSIFRQLAPSIDRYPAMRLIRLEGDRTTALDLQLFHDRFDSGCVLVNGLGATECGLVSQFFLNAKSRTTTDGTIPIGYPVQDMTVRVVDDADRPLPPDAIGEIVIESPFLATGYWNNPSLTAEKLIPVDGGIRRYRTGDLGKIDGDGCLIHLGRRDNRPKLDGLFVNTGEIESVLLTMPGIGQAVVSVVPSGREEHLLVAYIVAEGTELPAPAANEIRDYLKSRLAASLLPSKFVTIDAMPLTADGKLDCGRLPTASRARPPLSVRPVAPSTASESAIARIWSDVLEIDDIGIDDPFFDLGGDSLHAGRVVGRLVQETLPGFAQARIVDLFEHETIRALAAALNARHGVTDRDC